MEDLVWEGERITWRVPAGFKTDLTTSWFEGRHTDASVLHDYLLKQAKLNNYSRNFADATMNLAMKSLGVRPWRRRVIMMGITLNTFVVKHRNK